MAKGEWDGFATTGRLHALCNASLHALPAGRSMRAAYVWRLAAVASSPSSIMLQLAIVAGLSRHPARARPRDIDIQLQGGSRARGAARESALDPVIMHGLRWESHRI